MTERTVLAGMTLIDGTGGAARTNASVVIDGAVITEVGDADTVATTPDRKSVV